MIHDLDEDLIEEGPAVLQGPVPPLVVEQPMPHEDEPSYHRRLVARAAWFLWSGKTLRQTADLCECSDSTIKKVRKLPSFKRLQSEYQQSHEEQVKCAQQILASRQLDYIEETHNLAMSEKTPPGVKLEALKTLMNRSDAVPEKRVATESSGNALVIPNDVAMLIGSTIAQSIASRSEPEPIAIEAQVVRDVRVEVDPAE